MHDECAAPFRNDILTNVVWQIRFAAESVVKAYAFAVNGWMLEDRIGCCCARCQSANGAVAESAELQCVESASVCVTSFWTFDA